MMLGCDHYSGCAACQRSQALRRVLEDLAPDYDYQPSKVTRRALVDGLNELLSSEFFDMN